MNFVILSSFPNPANSNNITMRLPILFSLLLSSQLASSQRNVYTDHNKLVQNKAENGGYYLIGPYKVQGNPYYVKESVLGAMFSPGETARNVHLRYDMYNQNIEFITTANPDQPLMKEPGEIDSFTLYKKRKAWPEPGDQICVW